MRITNCGLVLLDRVDRFYRANPGAGPQGVTFQTAKITLATRTGRYDFTVAVANNNASQTAHGLRYLHEIPPTGAF